MCKVQEINVGNRWFDYGLEQQQEKLQESKQRDI